MARVLLLIFGFGLLNVFCGDPVVAQQSGGSFAERASGADVSLDVENVLVRIVQRQAKAWNRGDIPAFMEAYWQSEQLTFSSGGKTTRGWIATRDGYLARYPDKATMGKLTFSDLEVQLLDDRAALMLGRWRLDRENPIGGNFSLVWREIDSEWVIVHDHTSSDPPQ